MSKIWLIFKHEYLHHVLNKRFLLAILGMPAVIVISALFGILAVVIGTNHTPIGYVDQSGLIVEAAPPPEKSFVEPVVDVIRYPDETSARQALDEGKLQGYYIFPTDYLKTGIVQLVAPDPVASSAETELIRLITHNLLVGQPEAVMERIQDGPLLEIRSSDQKRQLSQQNWIGIVLPLVAAVLFMIAVNASGGYLLQALVDEKENRTIEILLTSVSSDQLMIGKTLGNLSVGITPLLVWLLVGGIVVGFFINSLPAEFHGQYDWNMVWVLVLSFIPAFLMISALMAAVGATATEAREAQQVAGLFSLPIMLPLFVLPALMQNPDGMISVTLSLIPFTAPVALTTRISFSTVPAWQLILSISLIWLMAAGALWLAGRAFRLGMMRYGKKVSFRELFHKEAVQ